MSSLALATFLCLGLAAAHDGEHRFLKMADGTYVCQACGYVYDPSKDGVKAFSDLPDDFVCPVCAYPKAQFRAWAMADDSEVVCLSKTQHKMTNDDTMPMDNTAMEKDPCKNCYMNPAVQDYLCLPSIPDKNMAAMAAAEAAKTTAEPQTTAEAAGAAKTTAEPEASSTSVLRLSIWTALLVLSATGLSKRG